ncbi:MAG TPA: hypothetical protein VFJ65_00405 [Solirubrobacterales bacterium]|nr:hypothetical protein [Solirubrobacterales bacterium]
MTKAGIKSPQPIQDSDYRTTCPICGTEQSLDQAGVSDDESGFNTTYDCTSGCGPILIVSDWSEQNPQEGAGYRIGDWVVRNPRDLFFFQTGLSKQVVFPASPAALGGGPEQ